MESIWASVTPAAVEQAGAFIDSFRVPILVICAVLLFPLLLDVVFGLIDRFRTT